MVSRCLFVLMLVLFGALALPACGGDSGDDDDRRESRRDSDDDRDDERGDTDRTPARPRRTPAGARRTPTAEPGDGDLSYEELIELTIQDLEAFWTRALPETHGIEYEPVTDVGPYDSSDPPECGGEEVPPGNAVYCPFGDFVAWDEEDLLRPLFDQAEDFGVSLVLAHEWGHAIQGRAGALDAVSILLELQADCFAGSWAASVDNGESEVLRLDPGDIDEAISGYLQFRDTPGTSPAEIGAHGSAFDRVNAFWDGFQRGASFCAALRLETLTVFDLPITEQDLQTGGNLPLEDVLQLAFVDLERYWEDAMVDAYGVEFGRVPDLLPFDPFDDDLPSCGPQQFDSDDISPAFYCPPDDYIAWDEVGFLPTVYDNFGDFAVAFVFAHEWGHAVQLRARVDGATIDLEMQADCFGGAWAGSVARGESPGLSLSAGDLDEAVAGFLELRDPIGTPQSDPGAHGTAFQRVAAFRDGFLLGVIECKKFAAQLAR